MNRETSNRPSAGRNVGVGGSAEHNPPPRAEHDAEEVREAERIKQEALDEHAQPELKPTRTAQGLSGVALAPAAPSFPVAEGNPHGHETPPAHLLRPGIPDAGRPGLARGFGQWPAGAEPIEANPELLAKLQDPYNERVAEKEHPTVLGTNAYGGPTRIPV